MEKDYLTTAEIKKIALSGLVCLDRICKEHGFKYYLAYGTLLGAVRHKGFIPWDDDIDVLMPREDYEKLLGIAKDIKTPEWEILSYKTNDDYWFPWAKLCNRQTVLTPSRFCSGLLYGIAIDIFPLDYIAAKDDERCEKILRKAKKRYDYAVGIVKPYGVKKTGLLESIKRCMKISYYNLLGKRRLDLRAEYADIAEYIQKYAGDTASYAINIIDRYQSIWKKEYFEDGCRHTLPFEGLEFMVPAQVEKVLEVSYGDYMELPPEEKRVLIHYYQASYIN